MRRFPAFWLVALFFTAIVHTAAAQVGGVFIDPQGVLREGATLDDKGRLDAFRSEAAAAPEANDVTTASKLRKVSLRRLVSAARERLSEGKPLSPEIRNLAGLVRLTHIFFYPDEDDVVLAGPAEGWMQAPTGEVIGTKSRRPVLQLDDLVQALRYAFDERPSAAFLGCSIEPTADGVKRYAGYMNGLRMDRSRLPEIFAGMERAMGPQAVKVYGVPDTSRFALKLVVADYRLKRIALSHDPSPVPEVLSYLDLQAKRTNGSSGPQRQHRWWFVARYDALHHSADQLAWEFEGQGVGVQTAPSTPGGAASDKSKKSKAGASKKPPDEPQASPAARQFATSCTTHFAKLADRVPVFAELQNLIGLSVAAELIAERSDAAERAAADVGANVAGAKERVDAPERGDTRNDQDDDARPPYRFDDLLDESRFPTEKASAPKSVPSLTNHRLVDDRHWVISISGGVEIDPRAAADGAVRKDSPRRKLEESRTAARRPSRDERPATWWWD